jgi:hypothetical protein
MFKNALDPDASSIPETNFSTINRTYSERPYVNLDGDTTAGLTTNDDAFQELPQLEDETQHSNTAGTIDFSSLGYEETLDLPLITLVLESYHTPLLSTTKSHPLKAFFEAV